MQDKEVSISRAGKGVSSIYMDANSSARMDPTVRTAMWAVFDFTASASGLHTESRNSRRVIEQSRMRVAEQSGVEPGCIVFTSGGTEANVTLLGPSIRGAGVASPKKLLRSALEHPSVILGHRFSSENVESINVTEAGTVCLDSLDSELAKIERGGESALVAVMHANNETGVIQPIVDIAECLIGRGHILHVDMAQSIGRLPAAETDLSRLNIPVIASLSAHKCGGPLGVGAMVTSSESIRYDPLLRGGAQESNRRSGTENVAAIVGFSAAIRPEMSLRFENLAKLRDRFECGLKSIDPDVYIIAEHSRRLPNTSCFSFPDLPAESLVIAADLVGLYLSAGAACSSGLVAVSPALEAMGLPETVCRNAVRASFDTQTSQVEVDEALNRLNYIVFAAKKRRVWTRAGGRSFSDV